MSLKELKTKMQPGLRKGPEPVKAQEAFILFSHLYFSVLLFLYLCGRYGNPFSPTSRLYGSATLIVTVVFPSIFKFLGK